MEEEEQIKQLFRDFQPELSSDALFMHRLQQKMEAVELVKRQNELLQRQGKLALAATALVGVVLGVVATLTFPAVSQWFHTLNLRLPYTNFALTKSDIPLWGCYALVAVLLLRNTFELVLMQLRRKQDGCLQNIEP